MIELTLEEGNKMSLRAADIKTVQDGITRGDLTCITLDSGEPYLVRESRARVLSLMEDGDGR
jgi:uncharacterized protein YlzI (FlbEa/FlbD family)